MDILRSINEGVQGILESQRRMEHKVEEVVTTQLTEMLGTLMQEGVL